MNDYLARLVTKNLGTLQGLKPRPVYRFEMPSRVSPPPPINAVASNEVSWESSDRPTPPKQNAPTPFLNPSATTSELNPLPSRLSMPEPEAPFPGTPSRETPSPEAPSRETPSPEVLSEVPVNEWISERGDRPIPPRQDRSAYVSTPKSTVAEPTIAPNPLNTAEQVPAAYPQPSSTLPTGLNQLSHVDAASPLDAPLAPPPIQAQVAVPPSAPSAPSARADTAQPPIESYQSEVTGQGLAFSRSQPLQISQTLPTDRSHSLDMDVSSEVSEASELSELSEKPRPIQLPEVGAPEVKRRERMMPEIVENLHAPFAGTVPQDNTPVARSNAVPLPAVPSAATQANRFEVEQPSRVASMELRALLEPSISSELPPPSTTKGVDHSGLTLSAFAQSPDLVNQAISDDLSDRLQNGDESAVWQLSRSNVPTPVQEYHHDQGFQDSAVENRWFTQADQARSPHPIRLPKQRTQSPGQPIKPAASPSVSSVLPTAPREVETGALVKMLEGQPERSPVALKSADTRGILNSLSIPSTSIALPAGSEPTEPPVQVTIGHLEVTATPPAPPSPPARRRTQPQHPAMNLASYLEGRSQGGFP